MLYIFKSFAMVEFMKRSPCYYHPCEREKTRVDEKTLQVRFSFLNEPDVKQLDNPDSTYSHCFKDLQLLKKLCCEIKGLCNGLLNGASHSLHQKEERIVTRKLVGKSNLALSLSTSITLFDVFPVNDLPNSLHVIGAYVFVLQIVSMLPDVDAQKGNKPFSH
jgi:hypothetical protein